MRVEADAESIRALKCAPCGSSSSGAGVRYEGGPQCVADSAQYGIVKYAISSQDGPSWA